MNELYAEEDVPKNDSCTTVCRTPLPWPGPCWIVSTPRSGSTWLASLLNLATYRQECPRVPMKDLFCEHFHPKYGHTYPHYEPVVTKAHVNWLDDPLLIQRMPPLHTKIILLTRDDHVQQVWSMIASSASQIFNTKEEERREAYRQAFSEVRVSSNEITTHLQAIDRWERLGRFLFSHYDSYSLSYEELLSGPETQVTAILDWLGMEGACYQESAMLRLRKT